MRVCVFGAGAIGGHLAARLAEGGAVVSVVARGAHLAAMQAGGITINAPDVTLRAEVTASHDPAVLGEQDAVLVCVKAPALPSVAAAIAPLLGARTKVAFVLNGIPWWYFQSHGGSLDDRRLPVLDPGDAMRRAVGPARVIGGVVHSACTVTAPGVIQVANARSRLVLGDPGGAADPAIEAIAAPLRAGGFTVDVTPRIRDAVWTKLLMNLCTGPLAVLGQSAPKGLYADPVLQDAARAIIAEGQAIATALGCTATVDVERSLSAGAAMTHKPSILQDLELGRPMEIDGIYATPLDLARLLDVPTPTLDMLVALTKIRARGAGLYGGVAA